MSASLLRRGLELLEPPGRAKAPPGLQRGRAGPRAAGAARRRKRAPEPGRNKATVKGRVVKSAIEEYHKKKPVNHLRENLFPTLEADGLQATATFGPAGQHFFPPHLQAVAQGCVPLLLGQRRVLTELIRLLAPFPALRHQLSIPCGLELVTVSWAFLGSCCRLDKLLGCRAKWRDACCA